MVANVITAWACGVKVDGTPIAPAEVNMQKLPTSAVKAMMGKRMRLLAYSVVTPTMAGSDAAMGATRPECLNDRIATEIRCNTSSQSIASRGSRRRRICMKP